MTDPVPNDPAPTAGALPTGAVPTDPVTTEPVPTGAVPTEPVPTNPAVEPVARRRRRNPLIYFWVYSLARITLYLVLWGLLWLFGLGGLIGAAVALLLSVPLSYVFLARPRTAMTAAMMERLNVRQERTADLDRDLSGGVEPLDD